MVVKFANVGIRVTNLTICIEFYAGLLCMGLEESSVGSDQGRNDCVPMTRRGPPSSQSPFNKVCSVGEVLGIIAFKVGDNKILEEDH